MADVDAFIAKAEAKMKQASSKVKYTKTASEQVQVVHNKKLLECDADLFKLFENGYASKLLAVF